MEQDTEEGTKINGDVYFAIPSLVALATFAAAAQAWFRIESGWAILAGGATNGVIGGMYFRWLCSQDDEAWRGIRHPVLASFMAASLVFVAAPYGLYAASAAFGHQLWNPDIMGAVILGMGAWLSIISVLVCAILIAGMYFAASHPKIAGWLVLGLSALGAVACFATHHPVWKHQQDLYVLAATSLWSIWLNGVFLRNQHKPQSDQRILNGISFTAYALLVAFGAYLSHTLAYSWQSLTVVGAGIATVLHVRPNVG